ncbi:hypothetical protein LJK87_22040 [Paenibacillus sp. P25]|nr:hypothetical protein LJK87_22040 [Paenibacillus sp. P25]
MYTKRYFGPERYSYLCNGSQGHSVPIIEGCLQKEGAEYRAQAMSVSEDGETDRVLLDLTAAYGLSSLQRLTRRLVWHKTEQPYLLLEDAYDFTAVPATLVERFMTLLPPDLSGDSIILPGKERKLAIGYDPKVVEPHVQKLEFTDHFGVVKEVYAIDFKSLRPKTSCKIQFSFQFDDEGSFPRV